MKAPTRINSTFIRNFVLCLAHREKGVRLHEVMDALSDTDATTARLRTEVLTLERAGFLRCEDGVYRVTEAA